RLRNFVLESGGPGATRTIEAAGRVVFSGYGACDRQAQSGSGNRTVGTGRGGPRDRGRIRKPARSGDTEKHVGQRHRKSAAPAACAGTMVSVARVFVARRGCGPRPQRRVLLLDAIAALRRGLPRFAGTRN